MTVNKQAILENLCYTELVYERINKKLNLDLSRGQIEAFILQILQKTASEFFTKKGKNFYVVSRENNIRITINSNTYRIIANENT